MIKKCSFELQDLARIRIHSNFVFLLLSELVFTELILLILYMMHEICYSQSRLYIGLPTNIMLFVKSILFIFGRELGCFWFVWRYTKMWEQVGMPENSRFMLDCEYQGEKEWNLVAEIYTGSLQNLHYSIYLLDNTTIFFCLWMPTLLCRTYSDVRLRFRTLRRTRYCLMVELLLLLLSWILGILATHYHSHILGIIFLILR
jgi:hypothetical protein